MTHAPDFFYEGAGRRAAVDRLFEEIHRAAALIALTGTEGSGRSAVLARFAAEVDPDVLAVATVTGDILMSAGQCLAAFSRDPAVALPADPAAAVAGVRAGGRAPVLLLDDAHELGEQPRAEVIGFCREHAVPLVLAGDAALGGDERVDAHIVLRAFREAETEDFVAGWLGVGDEDELPSHRTIERLHRQTGGMPGALAAALENGAATRNTWFPAGLPVWHVAFTALAGAVLLLLLWHFVSEPVAPPPVAGEIVVPLPAPQATATAEAPAQPGTRLSAVAVPRPLDVAPLPESAAAAVETPVALPPPAATATVSAPVATPPAAATAPAVATSAAAPAARPAVTPARPVAVRRYSADEDALLRERASRYTLQLFASFNEQAVRAFVGAHGKQDIRVFRTLREELPWYVAVTGVYRNKDEAKAAVGRMPADIQHLKPWARSLQGIQDELRRRKD